MIDAGKTVAIVQARMSSSRLPGKVLAEISGLPAIVFMAERLARAKTLDCIVIATSTDSSDDPLAACAQSAGLHCIRGSLPDVLDRFRQAASAKDARHVVRLTGDCPLIDPGLVDEVVNRLKQGNFDYVSNVDPPSYPDGLDCEAFTRGLLERAWNEACLTSEREHVTPFMRSQGGIRRSAITSAIDMSKLRWTVDHPDDLAHVRNLVARVAGDPICADRFDYFRASEHLADNREHVRNEGLAKSQREDSDFKSSHS